ncbi:MAG: hypothetical protein GX556_20160 [Fibrobacter sp.]|nr:hypothetical protein [Fibrobacter sp.]
MAINISTYLKSILFGTLTFLTVYNAVKYEIYLLLNPTLIKEQTSENTLISSVDYKLSVCKAKGSNSLKEIGKILDAFNLCPIMSYEVDKHHDLTINNFSILPLDSNTDPGQSVRLRI